MQEIILAVARSCSCESCDNMLFNGISIVLFSTTWFSTCFLLIYKFYDVLSDLRKELSLLVEKGHFGSS